MKVDHELSSEEKMKFIFRWWSITVLIVYASALRADQPADMPYSNTDMWQTPHQLSYVATPGSHMSTSGRRLDQREIPLEQPRSFMDNRHITSAAVKHQPGYFTYAMLFWC